MNYCAIYKARDGTLKTIHRTAHDACQLLKEMTEWPDVEEVLHIHVEVAEVS